MRISRWARTPAGGAPARCAERGPPCCSVRSPPARSADCGERSRGRRRQRPPLRRGALLGRLGAQTTRRASRGRLDKGRRGTTLRGRQCPTGPVTCHRRASRSACAGLMCRPAFAAAASNDRGSGTGCPPPACRRSSLSVLADGEVRPQREVGLVVIDDHDKTPREEPVTRSHVVSDANRQACTRHRGAVSCRAVRAPHRAGQTTARRVGERGVQDPPSSSGAARRTRPPRVPSLSLAAV